VPSNSAKEIKKSYITYTKENDAEGGEMWSVKEKYTL
jgi:hypothetical protein